MSRSGRFFAICASLASLLCLLSGGWVLANTAVTRSDEFLLTALGLYFIGQGLFIGPALWLLTHGRANAENTPDAMADAPTGDSAPAQPRPHISNWSS